jgi:AcrR family transcriptional regulator
MPRRGLDRAAVLSEAAALVDAEGANALALARLAERLNIRLPSLYNHIANLADLRSAVAVLVARELAEVLRSAGLGRSGAAALTAMAEAYRAYAMAHPGRFAAARRAPVEADDELRAALDAPVAVVLDVLTVAGIGGANAIHLVRAFRAAIDGFAMLEMSGSFRLAEDVGESFRRMIAALIAGSGLSKIPEPASTA